MANSTTNLDTISSAQAQKEVTANALFDALSPGVLFGRRASTTSALTWGYYGGDLWVDGVLTEIANGTVSLTASTTNYVEATRAGVVSKNTTGFTAGQIPLYTIVTGASSVTSYTDHRLSNTPFTGRLSKSVAGGADVTLSAAEARNDILAFTGALTANINVIVPTVAQSWTIYNGTSGAFTLTVKTAAGTGQGVSQGTRDLLHCDGTNVERSTSGGGGGGGSPGGSDGMIQYRVNATTFGGVARVTSAGNDFQFAAQGRLLGDFSNATLANRVALQDATTNNASEVSIIPNGTAASGNVTCFNASGMTNSGIVTIGIDASNGYIDGNKTGSGTTLPLELRTGGTARIKLNAADGTITIPTAGSRIKADLGGGTINNRLAFQDSAGGVSLLNIIGGGAAQQGGVACFYGNDPANGQYIALFADATVNQINSNALGGGTVRPMVLQTGSTDRIKLETSGDVKILAGATLRDTFATDGAVTVGQNMSAQFPSQLTLGTCTHATSRRVTLTLGGSWLIGSDLNGNGTKDLFFYDSAAAATRMFGDTSGQFGFGYTSSLTARLHAQAINSSNHGVAGTTADGNVSGCLGSQNAYGVYGISTVSSAYPLYLYNSVAASYTGIVMLGRAKCAADSGYSLLQLQSGDGADIEFNLRGDGNAFCDGSWSGGGADYAEFFEWADGNPAREDRVGLTVVFDSGDPMRIRPSVAGDAQADIIGVVSATPAVMGDAAELGWRNKYLRDDYGRYVTELINGAEWDEIERYTETLADGTVVQRSRVIKRSVVVEDLPDPRTVPPSAVITPARRRKRNPNFVEQPYIPRSRRPEWAAIGLMGKLWVRKGQRLGDRWKLMAARPGPARPDLYLVR